jgi:small-conductance mechanosensitive channel
MSCDRKQVVRMNIRTTIIENKKGDVICIPDSIFIANSVIKGSFHFGRRLRAA